MIRGPLCHGRRSYLPQIQTNYSVFKEGVKPMWEDTANRQVGRGPAASAGSGFCRASRAFSPAGRRASSGNPPSAARGSHLVFLPLSLPEGIRLVVRGVLSPAN